MSRSPTLSLNFSQSEKDNLSLSPSTAFSSPTLTFDSRNASGTQDGFANLMIDRAVSPALSTSSTQEQRREVAGNSSLKTDSFPQTSRRSKVPTPLSTTLDIPPSHAPSASRVYSRSPTSSSASVSQSNLLETGSVRSNSVQGGASGEDQSGQRSTFVAPSMADNGTPKKTQTKNKQGTVFQQLLSRTQSIRTNESMPTRPKPKVATPAGNRSYLPPISSRGRQPGIEDIQPPRTAPSDPALSIRSNLAESHNTPKTAPLEPEPGFKAMAMRDHRNRSMDRQGTPLSEHGRRPSKPLSSREGLFTQFKHTSTKAADGIGKAGKGFFGKLRTGSNERPPPPQKKELEVIRMRLADQARLTRLAKKYSDARDKTQFWLPSLPYRCIDYLNLHAVEEVGIYRQSGSSLEVERYLAKFDTAPDFDCDLLEDPDLMDVHIVSTVFKNWLRFLPDPIIPDDTQARICEACQDAREVPQAMRDELSMLPPHNYYLLFAITCHISLLHSHADKNLMTFENLCTCFMRSLKVNQTIFAFLILDWRNCWHGCRTETAYLTEERKLELAAMEYERYDSNTTAVEDPSEGSGPSADDERAISSSSSRPPGSSGSARPPQPPPKTAHDKKRSDPRIEMTGSRSSSGQGHHSSKKSRSQSGGGDPRLLGFRQPGTGQGQSSASSTTSQPPVLEPFTALSPMRM